MIKPIEEVLRYKNKYVVQAFIKLYTYYPLTEKEAEQIWEDLLRFLWLNAKVEEEKKKDKDWDAPIISISESMLIIDQLWHVFITNTQDYTDFCNQYLGQYVHHPVAADKYFKNIEKLGRAKANEMFLTELVSAVVSEFGEETAVRWFDEYFKYLPENAMELLSHHG